MIKVVRRDPENENRVELQCETTDLKATWPLTYDRGSEMTVCNETTETVDSFHYFNGSKWCTV